MAIKYPNKKTSNNNQVIYSNRGMSLEKELNESNKYYRAHNTALIYKKPTPVQIVRVDYPKREKAVIKEAFFQAPSTTDYNGVYRGKYIDFEAKETSNKTSFPLQNIHTHQVDHIRKVIKLEGIAFLIIRFKKLSKTYLLDGNTLLHFYTLYQQGGKKSINIKHFESNAYEIEQKFSPKVDYLAIVDKVYFSNHE